MTTETFDSGGSKIPVELFQPSGPGKWPAVVVAYGTAGMGDPFGKLIRSFANDLVERGYFVLIPHHFDRTGTAPGVAAYEAFAGNRDAWLETLGDALTYATNRGEVESDKIGLLGFSMGGNLVLRRAMAATSVKVGAVVEFFAPITIPPFNNLGGDIGTLAPLQIHHGENDDVVAPQESHELKRLLEAAGKLEGVDFELHFYPGEGHGFVGPAAVASSTQRTADFFDRHLT